MSRSGGGLGYSGDVTFNVPLADHVAFRFAGGRLKTEGSTDYRNLYKLNDTSEPINANTPLGNPAQADFTSQNDVNSIFTYYGRAGLLWKPQNNMEALLSYVYQNDKRGGNRVNTLGKDGFGIDYQFNQSGALIVEPRRRESNTGMLDLSWETDLFAFTSNTTLYNHKGSLVDDVTALAANNFFLTSLGDSCENTPGFGVAGTAFCFVTPYRLDSSRPLVVLNRSFEDKGKTQEFRIESTNNKKLDYVAGLYVHDRERTKTATLDKPGFTTFFRTNTPALHDRNSIQSDRWSDTTEKFESSEIATYGNVTYKATNKFRVGFGLRAFKYKSRIQVERSFPMFSSTTFSVTTYVAVPGVPRFETLGLDRNENDNGILPAFQLEYDLNEKEQLFFDFDKGFRPGGINTNALLEPNFLTFQSESSYNYELGVRGKRVGVLVASHNIHYELSLFLRSAHNQHISTFTSSRDTRDQLQTAVTINADRAEHRGLELKLRGENAGWGYGLDYVYMQKATLTKDLMRHPSRTRAGATVNTVSGVVSAGLPTVPFVLASAGTNIPFIPKHSLVLKSNYLINRDAMSINFFGSTYSQSDINISLTDRNRLLDSYTILNVGVGFLWGSSALYLFANNITNRKGILSEETATAGPSIIQNVYSSGVAQGIVAPRLVGVAFTTSF